MGCGPSHPRGATLGVGTRLWCPSRLQVQRQESRLKGSCSRILLLPQLLCKEYVKAPGTSRELFLRYPMWGGQGSQFGSKHTGSALACWALPCGRQLPGGGLGLILGTDWDEGPSCSWHM